MYNQPNMERISVLYKYHMSFAHPATRSAFQWYERDLKKRTRAGWRLVSVQESGRDVLRKPTLTAIYERSAGR